MKKKKILFKIYAGDHGDGNIHSIHVKWYFTCRLVIWRPFLHQRSKGYKIITSKVGLSLTCPAHWHFRH